jgi:phospholipase/carboxylesterase
MPAPYHALITPPAGSAPLVFAFHGTGGDETQFAALVHDMIPDAGLVAPRGDVSEGGANRYFRRTAEGVYNMPDLARRTVAMAAFVSGIRAAHPGRAAFALGYSNGANILAAMTFHHADLLDRIALLHPLIPWQPAPNPGLAGRAILITAGRRDPIAPLGLTEALVDYYRAQEARVTTDLHDGGHDIRSPEIAALTRFFSDTP